MEEGFVKYWYRPSLLLFLFLVGAMPAGTIYTIPVKHVALISLLAALSVYTIRNYHSINVSKFKPIFVGLAIIVALLFWLLIGALNGPEYTAYAVYQWKGLVLTVMLPAMILTLLKLGLVRRGELESIFMIAGIMFAIIKVAFVIFIAYGILDAEKFFSEFSQIFGIGVVHMELADNLYRLFLLNNDVVVLFSLYLVLSDRVVNFGKFLWLALAVLLLSIFFAYSRVLFVASLGVVVLALAEYDELKEILERAIHLVIAGIVAVFILWVSFNSDDTAGATKLLQERFNSEAVESSDSIRHAQIDALWGATMERPLLGSGLGSYVKELPAPDTAAPFSYDVQWLSYLYQLGFLGTLLLLAVAVLLPFLTHKNRYSKSWWITTLLFFGWLSMPITNPYLGNSTAGLVFSLFAVLFVNHNHQDPRYKSNICGSNS